MAASFADGTTTTTRRRMEEQRWAATSSMLDTMLFEKKLADIRQNVFDNATLRRVIEKWWISCGGTITNGIEQETYYRVHEAMYRILLEISDVRATVIEKGIGADWNYDISNGTAVVVGKGSLQVSVGAWYLSLIELADNWVVQCDGEAYAKFLHELLVKVFHQQVLRGGVAVTTNTTSSRREENCISNSGEGSWEETAKSLCTTARMYRDPPLVKKRQALRNAVEYVTF